MAGQITDYGMLSFILLFQWRCILHLVLDNTESLKSLNEDLKSIPDILWNNLLSDEHNELRKSGGIGFEYVVLLQVSFVVVGVIFYDIFNSRQRLVQYMILQTNDSQSILDVSQY